MSVLSRLIDERSAQRVADQMTIPWRLERLVSHRGLNRHLAIDLLYADDPALVADVEGLTPHQLSDLNTIYSDGLRTAR